MKSLCLRVMVLSLLIQWGQSLFAHQQKEAYTTILFNPRSELLEISHRFYLHDAEHALSEISSQHADIISNPETQKAFAEYVSSRFAVKDSQNNLCEMTSVGYEVEGKYFWVYQTTPVTENLQNIQVRMTALHDIWNLQVNHVNVEQHKQVRSIRLSKDDDWQSISLLK